MKYLFTQIQIRNLMVLWDTHAAMNVWCYERQAMCTLALTLLGKYLQWSLFALL